VKKKTYRSTVKENSGAMSPKQEDPRKSAVFAHQLAYQSHVLENPLAYIHDKTLQNDAEHFCRVNGMEDYVELFRRAALLAKSPDDHHDFFSDQERKILEEEHTHKWKQTWPMYYVALVSSFAAVVQGMDESVFNGAMKFYNDEFGIEGWKLKQGLVNSAPYLCCFALACWLTMPLNHYFGRRGTIWISCLIAAVASIWEAFTFRWWQLFLARFVLGLGIGPKSTTAPIYTAECSPAPIRGALVMMWQMWTAFGIMLGYIVGLIFQPSKRIGHSLS
jgi:hypothetical protein